MRLLHVSVRPGRAPLELAGLADTPDLNLAWALGARETRGFDAFAPEDLEPFDALLVTMWKVHERKREPSWMHVVRAVRERWGRAKRILVYQEAEGDWLGHRPDEEQRAFLANVAHADLFLAHTEDSAAFYGRALAIPAGSAGRAVATASATKSGSSAICWLRVFALRKAILPSMTAMDASLRPGMRRNTAARRYASRSVNSSGVSCALVTAPPSTTTRSSST